MKSLKRTCQRCTKWPDCPLYAQILAGRLPKGVERTGRGVACTHFDLDKPEPTKEQQAQKWLDHYGGGW